MVDKAAEDQLWRCTIANVLFEGTHLCLWRRPGLLGGMLSVLLHTGPALICVWAKRARSQNHKRNQHFKIWAPKSWWLLPWTAAAALDSTNPVHASKTLWTLQTALMVEHRFVTFLTILNCLTRIVQGHGSNAHAACWPCNMKNWRQSYLSNKARVAL